MKRFLIVIVLICSFAPVFARIDGFSIGGGFQIDEYLLPGPKDDALMTFNFGFNIDADLFFTRKFSLAMNTALGPVTNLHLNEYDIRDDLSGILFSHRIGVRYFFLDTRVFDLGVGGGLDMGLLLFTIKASKYLSYSQLHGGIGIYLELPMRFYPAKRFWIGLTPLIAYHPYRSIEISTSLSDEASKSNYFFEDCYGLLMDFRIAFGFRLQ